MAERFWDAFPTDPRAPEHAGLRATDADRERAQALVAEAYADGRLDRDDLDLRVDRLGGPLTLGELTALVADLEPAGPAPDLARRTRVPSPAELAVAVASTLACVLVWQVSGRGFFWPLWVIVYTGLPVVATLVAGRRVTAPIR